MKIKFFRIIFLLALLVSIPLAYLVNSQKAVANCSTVFPLKTEQITMINAKIKKMNLFDKCAQLVYPYGDSFESSDMKSKMLQAVRELHVGGFVFFAGDAERQIKIINALQDSTEEPLLISADYENGPAMRLSNIPRFPSNMALGAVNDPSLTYLAARATAKLSKLLGVFQDLAPLADVNTHAENPIINVRAFSEDPFEVSVHVAAYVRGLNSLHVISTAKHFPGHGSTTLDSHNEMPTVKNSKYDFEKSDLIPFREAIEAGVKAIMVGHLQAPAYEKKKDLPATLSKSVITDLLRKKLGFDGLIVTDAMNMGAISARYPADEAAVLAIEAGNDLILYPADDSAAVYGIYNAVKSGRLSEERIDESLRRLFEAKTWAGLYENRKGSFKKLEKELSTKKYDRIAREIAERSITLVKDDKHLLPVNPAKIYSSAVIALTDFTEREELKTPLPFDELLVKTFNYTKEFKLYEKSKQREYDQALQFARRAKIIFLPVFWNVKSYRGTIELPEPFKKFISKILRLKKPVIIVSFGTPYLIKDFPNASTYLCAYGSAPASQYAAYDALLGHIKIQGKLPVTIPNTSFTIGSGIAKESQGLYFPKGTQDTLYDFTKVDSLMEKAIRDSVFPGAVLLVAKRGRVILFRPYGKQTYDKDAVPVTKESMFDLASVTKVVGTTSAAMLLYDEGKLDLDAPVVRYLPQFGKNGKDKITIRNLLLHNSGLPAWVPFYKKLKTPKEVIDSIMNIKLDFPPGTKYQYSDLGMITLQKVIEKITGTTIDKFLKKRVFKPLGMTHTMYNPSPKYWYYCMPTERDNYWRMELMKGKVHDEAAYLLGGVAGHAGLFSTADDVAKLVYTVLNHGNYGGLQLFKASTVDNWTTKQTQQSTRALGWDTKSPEHSSFGTKFSLNSFGHTGFTGTSVWANKDRDVLVVLLTNRVYPTRKNRKIIKFRPKIHDAIFDAVVNDIN